MRVIYKIDSEKDKRMIYTMLRSQDPSGNWNRAKSMGIGESTFKLIEESKSYEEVQPKINEIYEERLLKDSELLSQKKNEFQDKWDEINDRFFDETKRVTGLEWKFDEYVVIISLFHPGISNMDGNEVYLWIYDDTDVHLRVVAHELLMTHIWKYFFSKFPGDEIMKNWNRYWSVNEIVTSFILGLEKPLNDLWSEKMKGYMNFLQNYPQLLNKRDLLVTKYQCKKSFEEFMEYALSMF